MTNKPEPAAPEATAYTDWECQGKLNGFSCGNRVRSAKRPYTCLKCGSNSWMAQPGSTALDAELHEIQVRVNRATKGPWAAYHRVSPRGAYRQWHIGNFQGLCQITMNGQERDYQFMAHARTDIPRLLEIITELRRKPVSAGDWREE